MRIIVHIGNGKTGTTSIQDSLVVSEEKLAQHGVKFLGFMLDAAPVQVAPWQREGVHPNASMAELAAMDPKVASDQIFEALRANVDRLAEDGVHTVIWSNERFFDRPGLFEGALKKLEAAGHDVTVVAYVRRHDMWARSVHNQWYIKHKRNIGESLSFRHFIENYKVTYAPPLVRWDAAFGENFVLRNFDAASNVVLDFCEAVGIDPELVDESRSNETPGPEETMLRIVLSERLNVWEPGQVDMAAFERLIRPERIDFTTDPVDAMNELLPDEDDLRRVAESSTADRERVDALLAARGQPPIDTSAKPVRRLDVDRDVLDSALFQMVADQAREIRELRAEVSDLQRRMTSIEAAARRDRGSHDGEGA